MNIDFINPDIFLHLLGGYWVVFLAAHVFVCMWSESRSRSSMSVPDVWPFSRIVPLSDLYPKYYVCCHTTRAFM